MCLCVFTTGIVFFLASLTTVHCSCHCQLVTILMVGKLFAVIFRLIIILLFQMCCCCCLNAATDLACQRSSTKDTLCQCLQLCCCWSSHCVLSLFVFFYNCLMIRGTRKNRRVNWARRKTLMELYSLASKLILNLMITCRKQYLTGKQPESGHKSTKINEWINGAAQCNRMFWQ